MTGEAATCQYASSTDVCRPDAIHAVINALRAASQPSTDPLRLARALLILLHIIKELSTARLQRSRQSLLAATSDIISVLGRIYIDKVQVWSNGISSNTEMAQELHAPMELSLLALKALRRLLVAGYEFPNRNEEVHQFWSITFTQVGSFISYTSQHIAPLPPQTHQLVEKHLLQLSKLHLEMAKTHPAAFVYLPNSLDLVKAYWGLVKQFSEDFGSKTAVVSALRTARIGTNGDQGDDKTTMEKLSLKGLLLIRACLRMVFSPAQTFRYRHPQEKEEKAYAERTVKDGLLTRDFVEDLTNTIVNKFFVFQESDLREWEEEPEEWERSLDSEGEGFEFSIRPCSEKLFLDLAINFKDILIQPLLAVFSTVATPDNEDILFKDSVYSAIGLSSVVLYEHLDFNAFLTNTLAVEVQKQNPGYNILRRRAAILIAQWITVKIADENVPLVCQIFQHLLDRNDPLNDQVVRVTAGRQFKDVADAWEFKAKHFLPFAETTMTRLMQLIEEVELTETKMALLNTISVLVERLEHDIAPYADRIISLLPPLWEQAEDEHLMKQAILAILARLVNALKAASVPFHSMLIPIIQGAVEPGSESQLYLLEDALDLWSAIIAQSPTPASAELFSLIPYLFSVFELGSESLRRALEIAESYLLIAPQQMLSEDVRQRLLNCLSGLVGTLKSEANGMVNNQIEIIIRTAERLGGESAVSQVTSDLISAQFLSKQLAGLRGSWVAHCTTGPLAKEPAVDGMVETDYLSVLARLALSSSSIFLQAVLAAAPSIQHGTPASIEDTMKWLLEEWFSHFENIGDPGRRKLMCLALTNLLSTSQPFILQNLQLLMSMWTDVIVELRGDEEDPMADSLVLQNAEALKLGEGPEAPEDERRRELTLGDPVHRVRLPEFVKHHLQAAIQACGGYEAFRERWLGDVDQDVVNAFGKLGVV